MRIAVLMMMAGVVWADGLGEMRAFVGAKWRGEADARAAAEQIVARVKGGAFGRNRRGDRALRIGERRFERGLAMPGLGEMEVRLSGAARAFDAVIGVDANDLGYYDNAGRGMVVASVEAGGRELYRSAVMKEGLAGAPVHVELGGARSFVLKLAAGGERKGIYLDEWNQLDWAEARVTMMDGRVVWLAELAAGPLPGGYGSGVPFSFKYGGRGSGELLASWKMTREKVEAGAGRRAERVVWRAEDGLEVRAEVVEWERYPFVEWTVYFKNAGRERTALLEDIQGLDCEFERTPEGEFKLHHSIGSPNSATDFRPLETVLRAGTEKAFVAKGGRPSDADLPFFNLEWAGGGATVAVGWPGQWAARFGRDKGTRVGVKAGQELTHLRLEPGEEIRTPLVVVGFWRGGDWIDAQNVWRRWMVEENLPKVGGRAPGPMLTSGSSRQTIEMQEATEENQLLYLKKTLDAGIKIDYWWMDAGWYPYEGNWSRTGTWEVDRRRFPRGLKPISEAAKARGVKTLVWFEPERVTAGTWLEKTHPEWLLGAAGRDRLLDLGNRDAWRWLVEHVSGMLKDEGIGLYRQDFNFEPLRHWRGADREDRQGMAENLHVQGYLAYFDELRKRFPGMLLDTCASGGRRDDLETLRRAVPLWRSDFAYAPEPMQQFNYGMALWIPYFGSAFNSLDPYIFRSQMTPALAIGMVADRYENGVGRMKALIEEWRQAAGFYMDDFYPLTPYGTEVTDWLAWQFNRGSEGRGMVQAFRREGNAFEVARFRLRGLEAGSRYRVGDKVVLGRELMEKGLEVRLEARPAAAVVYYERVK